MFLPFDQADVQNIFNVPSIHSAPNQIPRGPDTCLAALWCCPELWRGCGNMATHQGPHMSQCSGSHPAHCSCPGGGPTAGSSHIWAGVDRGLLQDQSPQENIFSHSSWVASLQITVPCSGLVLPALLTQQPGHRHHRSKYCASYSAAIGGLTATQQGHQK